MLFDVMACPQCGAPLPRQARWRMVNCPNCGSMVTRREDVVLAARFREAYARSRGADVSGQDLFWQGKRYRLVAPLGRGRGSDVFLAERVGAAAERATLKLARPDSDPGSLAREAALLKDMQATEALAPAYLTQRLPELLGCGVSGGPYGEGRDLLLLRHPTGYWGSLADVRVFHPDGVDPRHAVWMWRRILETLAFVHGAGWVHTEVAPEHLLVNPRDHGVLLIGWSRARRRSGAKTDQVAEATIARDIVQAAWSIRSLLCGDHDMDALPSSVPMPMASLLLRCCEDPAWCGIQGAERLDQALRAAALEAFGPPKYIPFIPDARA